MHTQLLLYRSSFVYVPTFCSDDTTACEYGQCAGTMFISFTLPIVCTGFRVATRWSWIGLCVHTLFSVSWNMTLEGVTWDLVSGSHFKVLLLLPNTHDGSGQCCVWLVIHTARVWSLGRQPPLTVVTTSTTVPPIYSSASNHPALCVS